MGPRVGIAGGGTDAAVGHRIPRQRRHTGSNAAPIPKDPTSPAVSAAADKRARKNARRTLKQEDGHG